MRVGRTKARRRVGYQPYKQDHCLHQLNQSTTAHLSPQSPQALPPDERHQADHHRGHERTMEDPITATKIKELGITMEHPEEATMVLKASTQNHGVRTKGRGTTMGKAYGAEIKIRRRERPNHRHQENKARCLVLDQDHPQPSSWWLESPREH